MSRKLRIDEIATLAQLGGLFIAVIAAGLPSLFLAVGLAEGVRWGPRSASWPWYFPGDPPLFDLGLIFVAPSLVITTAVWLCQRRFGRGRRGHIFFSRATTAALCLAAATAALCMSGIAFRLSPAWREVRNGIRYYGDQIAMEAGDKERVLRSGEFVRLREKHLPRPVPVTLTGYGTVYLRFAHAIYPYVGVAFSDSAHALFDPDTMMCIYSD